VRSSVACVNVFYRFVWVVLALTCDAFISAVFGRIRGMLSSIAIMNYHHHQQPHQPNHHHPSPPTNIHIHHINARPFWRVSRLQQRLLQHLHTTRQKADTHSPTHMHTHTHMHNSTHTHSTTRTHPTIHTHTNKLPVAPSCFTRLLQTSWLKPTTRQPSLHASLSNQIHSHTHTHTRTSTTLAKAFAKSLKNLLLLQERGRGGGAKGGGR